MRDHDFFELLTTDVWRQPTVIEDTAVVELDAAPSEVEDTIDEAQRRSSSVFSDAFFEPGDYPDEELTEVHPNDVILLSP